MLYDDGFLHAHAEIEVALSLGKNSRQAWVTLPDSQPANAYDWLLRLAETRNQQDPSTYTINTNGSQVIVTLGTTITLPANFYLSGYFIGSNRQVLSTMLSGLTSTVDLSGDSLETLEWYLYAWESDAKYYALQASDAYTLTKTDTTLSFALTTATTQWKAAKAVSVVSDASSISLSPFALGTSYDEVTRNSDNWPTALITYDSSSKNRKIMEEQYTRDGDNNVTQYAVISYGNDGVEDARVTESYSYDSDGNVQSVIRTES